MRSDFWRSRRRAARVAALACAVAAVASCRSGGSGTTRVVIPSGSPFRAAAESLAHAGLVPSSRAFSAYAAMRGYDKSLRPGTYVLARGASWSSLARAITSGHGIVNTVTVPEGFALSSIVPALARTLSVPEEAVEAAVRDTALRHELDVPTPTLEGYLFPDTYTFADGTTPLAAVQVMVRALERRWKPEWDAQLQKLALSRHDVLTLASIVEKEARKPEERPVIAAVYYNRLRKGMPLQADPTVQYALGRHVTRVLYRDLEIDSPYNTYRRKGLPPGPIASPGLPSIEAALFPANVPYLYFVAAADGHHEFRTTFAEHAAVAAALRKARLADSAASRGAAGGGRR